MKKSFDKIYILDTNIILNDAHNIEVLSEGGKNLIILPETVIDELDTKKTGFEEINFQAREFGRLLQNAEVTDTHKVGDTKNVMIMEVLVKDSIVIHIISYKDYELDVKEHSILNDRKIIKVASFASTYYKNKDNTLLISDDIMCRTRAISLGVNTTGMLGKRPEDYDIEFIKEIQLDSIYFNSLNNKPIVEYDPEYKPENYCYSFISPDGNSCYAYICNERIQIISEPIWKGMKVKPLNLGQKFAVAGMLDSTFDIVYLNAIAGSGKTLLSLAAGMREVDIGKYDKILYIRNSIESLDKGESVGFLSGNEEKFRIYNYPLYDSLDFISSLGSTKKEKSESSGEERIEELIAKYQIQTLWVGALRGRSLDNAFVIIDEQQNISKKTMQTILTRIGKNCKVVLIGSSNQIDNLYINKYTNADSVIREALKEKNEYVRIFATKLNKVVRGSITEFAERLFTTSLKD